MMEFNAVNALLAIAAWLAACFIAVTQLQAVQRLLAWLLQCHLRRIAAPGDGGKHSYRVTATPTGASLVPLQAASSQCSFIVAAAGLKLS